MKNGEDEGVEEDEGKRQKERETLIDEKRDTPVCVCVILGRRCQCFSTKKESK